MLRRRIGRGWRRRRRGGREACSLRRLLAAPACFRRLFRPEDGIFAAQAPVLVHLHFADEALPGVQVGGEHVRVVEREGLHGRRRLHGAEFGLAVVAQKKMAEVGGNAFGQAAGIEEGLEHLHAEHHVADEIAGKRVLGGKAGIAHFLELAYVVEEGASQERLAIHGRIEAGHGAADLEDFKGMDAEPPGPHMVHGGRRRGRLEGLGPCGIAEKAVDDALPGWAGKLLRRQRHELVEGPLAVVVRRRGEPLGPVPGRHGLRRDELCRVCRDLARSLPFVELPALNAD